MLLVWSLVFGHWRFLTVGFSAGRPFGPRLRRIGAFVADLAAGAIDRLFHCFTR